MIKRTIEISGAPAHLTVKDGQLVICTADYIEASTSCALDSLRNRIPLEDIGLVMVDHRGATFSLSALTGIVEHGGAMCVCSANHLPSGLLLPLATRHETVWRLKDQFLATAPTKKRLWRQIVKAKILAQAGNLPRGSVGRQRLLSLRSTVKSGDHSNVEAHAARIYWAEWLGRDAGFKRIVTPHDDGTPANAFLNYGYAVIRAAVARAIVSAGLIPAIGIHHNNRSNSFCLADDLMEPLRPIVDSRVRDLLSAGYTELGRTEKASLLAVLTQPVRVRASHESQKSLRGPLLVSLHRYVASFVACLPKAHRDQRLAIPVAMYEPERKARQK